MIEGLLIALVLVMVILLLVGVERAERLGGQHGRWIFDDPGIPNEPAPPVKAGPRRA
jgi:hypothetical protein